MVEVVIRYILFIVLVVRMYLLVDSEIMRQLKRNQIPVLSDFLLSQFWSKVDVKKNDECWNWKDHHFKEYPKFVIEGNRYRASRISLFIKTGEQDYEVARHTCDNPRCCNPHHLVWGTLEDNMQDKVDRNRSSKLPGASNGRAKLTESDVRYIRDTYSVSNCTKEWLSDKFGVSTTAIRMILDRVTWKHIP